MFRIKIVLLSILISGSVLIVFGLYFLDVIHDVSLDRIDRENPHAGRGAVTCVATQDALGGTGQVAPLHLRDGAMERYHCSGQGRRQ